ncbi:MAG: TIGR02281 family clan AA aspartic protease [Candidatus Accumulibacter sp.]|jgi:aspartyl protease family protein|nr:TIGR02281 family clan AA aspartic protease [Accumulibacter sp.]
MKIKRYVIGFAFLLGIAAAAQGTDVGLAGIFPGKALLTINGGAPRTVAIGATIEGVKLISIGGDTATLEVDGAKRVMRVGQNVAAQRSTSSAQRAILTANSGGHFITLGSINGGMVRFLVDTGASLVSVGASDAKRLALDTLRGERGFSSTANGLASVTRVKLDTVRVGGITLHGVDGLVHENDMPYVLLGMSFLNRMEMSRSGDTMTLKKRF